MQKNSISRTAFYKMAYPHSYYPIKNYTMYRSGNWRWAAPGDVGNRCERCGTHCFCAAEEGELSRTRNLGKRSAAAAVTAAAAVVAAEAIDNFAGAAEAIDAAAGAYEAVANEAVAENAAVQLDGIAAILMYDGDE